MAHAVMDALEEKAAKVWLCIQGGGWLRAMVSSCLEKALLQKSGSVMGVLWGVGEYG